MPATTPLNAAARNGTTLPLPDSDIPPLDFLEAVQRLFGGPVCAWIKCKGFLDGNQLIIRAELPRSRKRDQGLRLRPS